MSKEQESGRNKRRRELSQSIEDLLRANPAGLTQTEIAFYLGIDRSNVFRLLSKFEDAGILLWEDEKRRYGIFDREVVPAKAQPEYITPVRCLEALLERQENLEAQYQQLFQEYPWIFGTYYKKIARHQKFDDDNIPDFLGVRAHDEFLDIFEIKSPFLKLFRSDGNFSSEFNDAWNQAERYISFAQVETDYLRRKGLMFENPKCILIIGYNLSDSQISKVRTKQRLHPSIQLMTYNHVLTQAKTTVDFIQQFLGK